MVTSSGWHTLYPFGGEFIVRARLSKLLDLDGMEDKPALYTVLFDLFVLADWPARGDVPFAHLRKRFEAFDELDVKPCLLKCARAHSHHFPMPSAPPVPEASLVPLSLREYPHLRCDYGTLEFTTNGIELMLIDKLVEEAEAEGFFETTFSKCVLTGESRRLPSTAGAGEAIESVGAYQCRHCGSWFSATSIEAHILANKQATTLDCVNCNETLNVDALVLRVIEGVLVAGAPPHSAAPRQRRARSPAKATGSRPASPRGGSRPASPRI